MKKSDGRRNTLLVASVFFLMFGFFMLSFEGVSAVACGSYDAFGWERTSGACVSAASAALLECRDAGCDGGRDIEECAQSYVWSVDCFASTPVEDPCDVTWPVFGEALNVYCNVGSSGARVSGSCSPGDYNIYTIQGKHADFWDCERSLGDVSYVTYSQVCEAAPGCASPGPVCGNGLVESGESCDDGNTNERDACLLDCTKNPRWVCGAAWSSGSYTSYRCNKIPSMSFSPTSGACSTIGQTNTYFSMGEWQMDWNECLLAAGEPGISFKLYTQTCLEDESSCGIIPLCGDGIVEPGEDCDDANTDETDACLSNCRNNVVVCCDDDDSDGYSASMGISYSGVCPGTADAALESVCGTYIGSESDFCDDYPDRNPGVTEKCDNNIDDNCDGVINEGCPPVCGNVLIESGEECDDGNDDDTDGCSNCVIIPLLECCDDDDNDGWMGLGSVSSFFGTCTNLLSFGREKHCSDPSLLGGSEGDFCDDYPDRNPGVDEICGNNIDDNCDGVVDEGCPSPVSFCGDGIVDSPEEACDGNNLNDFTCTMLAPSPTSPSYIGGDLACTSQCLMDTSGCESALESKRYWADMNGGEITVANLGDTVQLIAEDMTSGTFVIKEDDILFDDIIRTDIVGVRKGSNLVGVWTIEEEDLVETTDYDDFYFSVGGSRSGDLEIIMEEDDDPTVVSIEGIACGDYFDEGEIVTIEVLASDTDDIITGTVSVYGNEIDFSNGGVVFDQLFDTPGSVQVLVEVDTVAGDSKKRVISNVMVLEMEGSEYVDASYVAACITKPEDLSNIEENIVDFDASDTKGVRVSGGVVDVLDPDAGDVFSWFWTFYPQGIERNFVDSTDRFAYVFTARFPIAGVNSAELRVEVD